MILSVLSIAFMANANDAKTKSHSFLGNALKETESAGAESAGAESAGAESAGAESAGGCKLRIEFSKQNHNKDWRLRERKFRGQDYFYTYTTDKLQSEPHKLNKQEDKDTSENWYYYKDAILSPEDRNFIKVEDGRNVMFILHKSNSNKVKEFEIEKPCAKCKGRKWSPDIEKTQKDVTVKVEVKCINN